MCQCKTFEDGIDLVVVELRKVISQFTESLPCERSLHLEVFALLDIMRKEKESQEDPAMWQKLMVDGVYMLLQKSTPETFKESLDKVLADLKTLMVGKQKDYGHLNITSFGKYGVLVRVSDKVARIQNLRLRGVTPENESVPDSWEDLVNYSIIWMMLDKNVFTLPLADNLFAAEKMMGQYPN